MKKLYYLLFILLIFGSCNKDEDEIIVNENPPIHATMDIDIDKSFNYMSKAYNKEVFSNGSMTTTKLTPKMLNFENWITGRKELITSININESDNDQTFIKDKEMYLKFGEYDFYAQGNMNVEYKYDNPNKLKEPLTYNLDLECYGKRRGNVVNINQDNHKIKGVFDMEIINSPVMFRFKQFCNHPSYTIYKFFIDADWFNKYYFVCHNNVYDSKKQLIYEKGKKYFIKDISYYDRIEHGKIYIKDYNSNSNSKWSPTRNKAILFNLKVEYKDRKRGQDFIPRWNGSLMKKTLPKQAYGKIKYKYYKVLVFWHDLFWYESDTNKDEDFVFKGHKKCSELDNSGFLDLQIPYTECSEITITHCKFNLDGYEDVYKKRKLIKYYYEDLFGIDYHKVHLAERKSTNCIGRIAKKRYWIEVKDIFIKNYRVVPYMVLFGHSNRHINMLSLNVIDNHSNVIKSELGTMRIFRIVCKTFDGTTKDNSFRKSNRLNTNDISNTDDIEEIKINLEKH